MSAAKRLTYIVNLMADDDTQHFVHIPNLLAHLERLGWHIDLVSERGGDGTGAVRGRSVTYLSRGARWGRLIPLVRHLLRMRARGGRLVFVRISKSAAMISALLGRLLGWKTVFWISGTVEDFNARHGGWRGRLDNMSMAVLLRLVDRLATGPETMVDYYAAAYGLPRRKVVLLYNDIDLASPPEFPVSVPAVPSVLMVHRLSPVRDTARYLPALLAALEARGQSVTLDIVGDGPDRPALERLCGKSDGNVAIRFHGAVSQRDVDGHYRRATVFIMPSYREGFPRVIIEAMARGLPIVSTDAGGTADLVGAAQKVFILPRDDVAEFARAVVRLLSSDDLRQALGQENLLFVERFATPQVARMYDRVLSGVLALPGTSRR